MNDNQDRFEAEPYEAGGAEAGSTAQGAGAPSGAERVGFCQNCGKPLTAETIRRVGPAVYCEPCLAARLGGFPAGAPGAPGAGVPPGYAPDAWMMGQMGKPGPNPGLAALLGLIPGVGAMYNEQYAKGIVHLIVFAILCSLSDHVNGIFGIFVAGWVVYMAIEAHHTARARRDGTPLPNPFGLNDIGERMGFGRAWPQGPTVTEVAQDAARAAAEAAGAAAAGYPPPPRPGQASGSGPGVPFAGVPPAGAAPAGHWGAPAEAYAEHLRQQVYGHVHGPVYRDTGYAPPAGWQPVGEAVPPFGAGQVPWAGPMPGAGMPPYAPMPGAAPLGFDPAFVAAPARRFPAGAAWLIGLGCLFLLATTGVFTNVSPEAMVGFVVLGFGVWLFVSRMFDSGSTMLHDGSAGYPLRILRALRVSVWLDAIGLLFVLDGFGIVGWKHSWPFLVILAGVMPLVERAMVQSVAASTPYPPVYPRTEVPTRVTPAAEPPEGGQ